jgi:hypothetical protein
MNMPGFRAELSLPPASGSYRETTASGGRERGTVSPAQLAAGRFQVTTRCCGFVAQLGRFVCTSREHPPWVQCRCHRTSFGPVIICRDPVIGF